MEDPGHRRKPIWSFADFVCLIIPLCMTFAGQALDVRVNYARAVIRDLYFSVDEPIRGSTPALRHPWLRSSHKPRITR